MKNLDKIIEYFPVVTFIDETLKIKVCSKEVQFCSIGIVGNKILFNYKFVSKQQMDKFHSEWIEKIKKEQSEKLKAKEFNQLKQKELDLEKENIKIGDVIVSTWGYDQTNVDMYQICEIKSKRILLKKIATKKVKNTEGFMCCDVIPDINNFLISKHENTEFWSLVKIIQSSNNKYFKFSGFASYEYVKIWNGLPQFCSWYA